jgi:hypothetical protein
MLGQRKSKLQFKVFATSDEIEGEAAPSAKAPVCIRMNEESCEKAGNGLFSIATVFAL